MSNDSPRIDERAVVGILSRRDAKPLRMEIARQEVADFEVVVDDEHVVHRRREVRRVEPPPKSWSHPSRDPALVIEPL